MAAGVVPQSSWSFSPIAPPRICSTSPSGADELPLPVKPKFIGNASVASSISWMCPLPGVHVVALVPVAGPVPPPMNVVTPLASAVKICCGRDEVDVRVDAAGGDDQAFAGNRFGRDADDHARRDAGHHVRIAGLADAADAAALDADVGFVDAGPVDDERVGDDAVERVDLTDARGLAHAVAEHLAAAELAFVAVDGVIAFDLARSDRCRRGGPDRRSSGRRSPRSGFDQ